MTTTATARAAADPDTIREYLSFYAGRPGLISICSDADRWVGRRFQTDAAGLNSAMEYALQLDKRRPQGIYVQVTTLREAPVRGRGGEDLAHCLSYIWADGDYGTIGHKPSPDDLPHPSDADDALKVIAEAIPLQPTVLSNSGGGINPAYAITPYIIGGDADRARIKKFTTDWQAIFGAAAYRLGFTWDTEVGNHDRLTRLIGTVNGKEEPFRQTSIIGGGGEIYELDQLIAVAEQLAPEAHEVLAQADREKRTRKVARTKQPIPAPRAATTVRLHSGDGPLDVIADTLRFRDVLEPAGFNYRGLHSDGREQWLRSAAGGDPSSAYSLLCNDHVAINWSERSDLPVGAQRSGEKLTVGRMYALLNYGGDTSAAAKDILRAAAGKPTQGAAGSLPVMVLTEVKRRCMSEAVRPLTGPSFSDEDWTGMQDQVAAGSAEEGDAPMPEGGGADSTPGTGALSEDRLPETFWNATHALLQIRQMARARRTSPDAVLHALLARVAAMADPTVRVDNGIHQPATLCWYCGLFGPSGSGKGQAENTAEELTPFPSIDLAYIDISTGQGLIAAYLDLEADPDDDTGKKKVLVQKRTRGYALATEGSVLDAMAQMSAAATLNGVLCKAWMSERQGTSNAEVERRRALPKGAYTLSMSLGVQEEPAAKLLEMGAIGLPQRLAWAHATLGPDTPKERPARTGPVTVATRGGEEIPVTNWVASLRNTIIPVPAEVTQALDDLALEISFGRGQEFPLDTHEPLWRVKGAALLALLHGRTVITADDWDMAKVMWQTSRRVRDNVQDAAKRRLRVEMDARRAEAVLTAVESQAAVYETVNGVHPSVVNVAKRAYRFLVRHGDEVPVRDVNRASVAKTDRDRYRASGADDPLWPTALHYGVEQGWLVRLGDGALLGAGSAVPE
ncbi:hypothetical protein [Streptacidiphilus sp. PAMC 29251]